MRYFLTIAASDTSGGAGAQQDLKMAQMTGFWGLSVLTAITAQNLQKVSFIQNIEDNVFVAQLEAIFSSFDISAIKIGVLPSTKKAEILTKYLKKIKCPVVYDPVFKSTSGYTFSNDEPIEILKVISKHCTVITPNTLEFEYIFGSKIISKEVFNLNPLQNTAFYIKGGHAEREIVPEYLLFDQEIKTFEYERLDWKYSHGTGCAFSSLLSMYLVENEIVEACVKARKKLVKFYEDINNGKKH